MMPQRQTVFGCYGNCFATCVAMLLDMSINDVPNFAASEGDWWNDFQEWLRLRGMFAIEMDCNRGLRPFPIDTLAILTGPARRGFDHCVIAGYAGVNEDGLLQWKFLHDPHPDDSFISRIDFICFLGVQP